MKIKHKLANRPSWSRIAEKKYACVRVDRPEFKGYATRLDLVRVKKPLYVFMHRTKLKVADDGYVWFMLFPDDQPYSLTVMVDDRGEIVQFYFDIVFKNYLDENGIPGFDDLFLDVVFTKDDSILLDEDDLSEALREGLVDADTADQAYFAAKRIFEEAEGHFDELSQWIRQCVSDLL